MLENRYIYNLLKFYWHQNYLIYLKIYIMMYLWHTMYLLTSWYLRFLWITWYFAVTSVFSVYLGNLIPSFFKLLTWLHFLSVTYNCTINIFYNLFINMLNLIIPFTYSLQCMPFVLNLPVVLPVELVFHWWQLYLLHRGMMLPRNCVRRPIREKSI